MLIDTHCHLSYDDYDNLDEIIRNMNGIMIASGCNDKTNKEVLELINKYDNVYGTLGIHPEDVDNIIVNSDTNSDIDNDLINTVMNAKEKVVKCMDELKVADAIDEVFNIFRRCNKYIDETTPWILAKAENHDRLKRVMYNLLESIRIGAVLLHSFLPQTSEEIFKQLNTSDTTFESIEKFGKLKVGDKLNDPRPLFIRIEKK